jgi:hypothetical protein
MAVAFNIVTTSFMREKLTVEQGRKAFAHHVTERALALREKYGNFLDYEAIQMLLNDRDFVRYPTRVEFDSSKIDPGFFAAVEPVDGSPANEHIIFLHEYFRRRPGDIANALLYQLVVVNYGDIATREEAELFGATALGMEQEEYYQLLCHLADQIQPSP